MPETILVTGGAGCIGSDLVDALHGRGHDLVVLDDLSSGKLEHIEPFIGSPRFRFVEGDLLDPAAVADALRGVEMVYHLAANPDVKYSPGDPTDRDLRQNTIGTYTLLEGMRAAGVLKIAFSSTSAVYGIAEKLPIPETHPCVPISLYGATKLGCEGMLSAYQHLFGFRTWIFRFANVVGPKVRKKGGTVISDFIGRLAADPGRLLILGNGKQAKSYLLSSECVEAMLHAVEHAPEPVAIYNLGGDDSLEVDRIAEMVVQALGLKEVVFDYTGTEGGWPGDVPRFTLDVSKIEGLGWKAGHTSEEAVAIAIQSTIDRMQRNGELNLEALCRQ